MKIQESMFKLESLEGTISTRINFAGDAIAVLVLAHGAGAGIDHQFIQDMQQYLADEQITSFVFNFLYRELKKRTPFRMTNPQKVYKEIWEHVITTIDLPVFAAGKSYGGRVGSTIVSDLKNCKGLIFLGYPFHPAGNLEKLRTNHLYDIKLPMLFLQGSRDTLSTPDIANEFVNNHKSAQLIWFEDGDHSWKARKKSGFSQKIHMQTAAKQIRDFCVKHQ